MRYIKALQRSYVDRPPIWFMRQAGRYLPEYRKLRSKEKSFISLCKNTELASEITLQPLRRFNDIDAAIIFSDILTIPDAMGLGLSFIPEVGPQFARPIRNRSDVDNLPGDVLEDLRYVGSTVKAVKKKLAQEEKKVPVIGFSGSPWTIATYMIEGSSSKHFSIARKYCYCNPDIINSLLDKLSNCIKQYLVHQIECGADALVIFDSWASLLPKDLYNLYSIKYISQIIDYIKNKHYSIPITVYSKGIGGFVDILSHTGCDAIGVDWTTDIAKLRRTIGNKIAIQGNLDPYILYASKEEIKMRVKNLLKEVGDMPGYIFNLGHGIPKDVDPNSITYVIESVYEFYNKI